MKRLPLILTVSTALMLGACHKEPPVSVQNAAEATMDNLEAQSAAIEARAADQVNAGDEDLSNAAAAFDTANPDNAVVANTN